MAYANSRIEEQNEEIIELLTKILKALTPPKAIVVNQGFVHMETRDGTPIQPR